MSDEEQAANNFLDASLAGSRQRPDGEQRRKAASAKRGARSAFSELAILIVVALTVALLIKTFVVQPFYIPSGSMENTLRVGDKILVNKLVYDIRPIGRGDIVVFNGSGSWDPPVTARTSGNPVSRLWDATLGRLLHAISGMFGTPLGQTDYVKRVIGIPCDHVVCCDAQGLITVNGVALDEKQYLVPGAVPSNGQFRLVVPAGRLFVLGDNRPRSADSRLHTCGYTEPIPVEVTCSPWDKNGTIPEDMVVGRVFAVVWPLGRMQILRVPATFGQPGPHRAAGALARLATAAPLAAGVVVRSSGPGPGAP